MDRDSIEELSAKLDVLTTVLAAQVGADLPLIERVPLLSRLGLDRGQIARVCGTTREVVSVRLAEAKRGGTLHGFKRRARRRE